MASKLSGWIDEAVGAAMIVAGVFCPPLAPYLIAAGSGLILSGIGALIEGLGAVHGAGVTSRNPVKSWDVIYGRSRVSGTTIYLNEWGNNNKYIDIVAVLACHPCRDLYAVLFNGRMVQIDTTAVPAGVPASTWPAINGGTSFSPLQERHNISSIARANNVVTVVVQDIPLLVAGEYIIASGVTTDATLNGTWPVSNIVGRAGGNVTFQYLCGGHAVAIGAQGSISTEWVDYGRHVYVEVMLGTQTLGTTFVGMTIGTPNEGDPTDLQHPSTNPWSANCSAVGRTVVFLRLNYDSNIFANGIPEISFLVHGKNNIADPRTSTVGYSENPALIFADYMTDQNYGFRCALGTEINLTDLATDANICDEAVALAAGGTEPRYMCNGKFELSISRGQILQSILSSCGGRLTNAAGTFRCNPAAWAGIGELISGTGTGFTARVTAVNNDGLETFDAMAPSADSAPYPGTVTWPGCNVINWAALLAFKAAAGEVPAFVQGIGNASAPGTPTFNTWTLAFAANNTAGNMLLVDVAFGTGYPLAGASVTDSQGNTYKPVLGGHVLGSSAFLMCFVAVDCAGGANTVTVTQTGDHGFDFLNISMAVHEYAGMSTSLPSGTPPVDYGFSYTDPTGVCDSVSYLGGPAADSLTPSVTVSQDGDLLHLIAATLPYCAGLIVSAGATPITPLAMAAGPFRWKSKVSVRDLFNAVKGTYISPASNWQASDFPPYMQDTLHGYYSGGSPMDPYGDANLAADDGERRYLDIQLPFTISVAAAQRLAKIELLRRRYQGNGTFVFNLGGLQMMALDVVAMNLSYFNWTGKLLEVLAFRFTLSAKQSGDARVIALATEIDVKETDPSIYEWNISEELTPQGYQQGTIPNPQNIASPTSLVLLSNSTTAVVSAQGVSSSRIEVSWTAPADAYIAEVQIQYQVVASPQSTVWLAGPSVPVSVTSAFIGGVVDGTNYYVQVRGVAASGIASPWVQAGPVTVAGSSSQLFTVNGT